MNIEGCDKPFTEGNRLLYFSFLRRGARTTMIRITIIMRRRRRRKLIPRINERSERQEERGESLPGQPMYNL